MIRKIFSNSIRLAAVAILWAAIEKYYELTKEEFLELVAFRIWIIIRNPNILLSPYRDQVERLDLASDFSVDMRQQFFEAGLERRCGWCDAHVVDSS